MTHDVQPPRTPTTACQISVIIPCHNRLAMLRDTLEAMLSQTLAPKAMEVVLVDSMSVEPLEELAAEFAARASFPIRYLRIPDLHGPVTKRNEGAKVAQGHVLAFTDSDCRPSPKWLAEGLAAFDDPKIGLASGPVAYKIEQKRNFYSKLSAETLSEHPTYPTANAFYRRDLFLALDGFDAQLSVRDFLGRATECADTDLAWRVLKSGWKNTFLPEAIVYHEVENLTPFQWLMEPTRLLLLPILVRLHPEIRPRLFWYGVIFHWTTLPIYFLLVFVVVSALLVPKALWLLPAGLLILGARRSTTLSPAGLLRGTRDVLLFQARNAVMAATLLAGSLRYGRLVL